MSLFQSSFQILNRIKEKGLLWPLQNGSQPTKIEQSKKINSLFSSFNSFAAF